MLTDRRADKRYNSIDLFKFIMAFAVVAKHTRPLANCTNGNILNAYDLLVGMAVPFFFLASGYLLAVKMKWPDGSDDDWKRILTQLKKIVQMYLIWTLIYLPLAVYHFISEGTPLVKAVMLYIRGFIFLGEQYNSWPLWYLLSTIYALILLYFALKRCKSPKLLIGISIIASIISIGLSVLSSYKGNLVPVLASIQKLIRYSIADGRILSGMIYIPIGMLLAYKKIPISLNWIGFVVGYVANFFVDGNILSSYLLIITSIAFFGIVENLNLKNHSVYPKLRKMSTMIYLLHMYIWSFYYKIVYGEKTYSLDSFLVTSIVSVAIAFIVLLIQNRRKKEAASVPAGNC